MRWVLASWVDIEDGAGGMGCELRCILALERGYARGELACVVHPHIVCELVGAFRHIGDKDVGGAVAVLAVEAYAVAVDGGGELLHRLEACGAIVGDGHIFEVAVDMDGEGHLHLVADGEGVGDFGRCAVVEQYPLLDAHGVAALGFDVGHILSVLAEQCTESRSGTLTLYGECGFRRGEG